MGKSSNPHKHRSLALDNFMNMNISKDFGSVHYDDPTGKFTKINELLIKNGKISPNPKTSHQFMNNFVDDSIDLTPRK